MNTHQVVFLLLDLCVIVVLGAVARRAGQPSVIGEILAGTERAVEPGLASRTGGGRS